jgi:serine/threonine-protein kinase
LTTIGRYEIESLIGRGAMGVVYLARDPQLGRRVALKTYAVPAGISEAVVEQFEVRLLREAHAAAALSHPNIVTVHDVGVDAARGIPYIVMEFVPGRSLKEILDGAHRLSPDVALRFGVALADALDAAHRTGIVHRDIKPANILVRDTDGIVKITDFGVARLSASELTRTGALVGSPAYMSPEQIRGAPVDARSDLFSLGVVLYEALTAKRPFGGEDLPSVAYSVAHQVPLPVGKQIRGLPRELDEFFERALAKNPEERFPDGETFGRALREAVGHLPATKRARASHREPAAAATASSAARAAAAATHQDPPEGAAPPAASLGAVAAQGLRRGRLFDRGGLVAFALLFLVTLGGVPLLLASRSAHLKLEAKSSIESGALTLRLDGREIYARRLAAPHEEGAMARLAGRNHEAFEAWLKIAPGKHELTAEVQLEGADTDAYRDTIVLNLAPGENRNLHLTAGRGLGRPVQLKVE